MSENTWVGTGGWEGWKISTDHQLSRNGQPVLINPEGEGFKPEDIIKITDVLTVPKAVEKWPSRSEPTLKRYLAEGKFKSFEARKVGGTWILTRQGMMRVFCKDKYDNYKSNKSSK